jgi:hypothetical protein
VLFLLLLLLLLLLQPVGLLDVIVSDDVAVLCADVCV